MKNGPLSKISLFWSVVYYLYFLSAQEATRLIFFPRGPSDPVVSIGNVESRHVRAFFCSLL